MQQEMLRWGAEEMQLKMYLDTAVGVPNQPLVALGQKGWSQRRKNAIIAASL